MQPPYYQNRNGYQPYNQSINSPSPSRSSKQLKYILSISRKHIALFLFLMLGVFGLFFILGLFAGYNIGKNSVLGNVSDIADLSTNTEYAYDNYNNYTSLTVNENLSSEISNTDTSGEDILEFTAQSVTASATFKDKDVLKITGENGIEPVKKIVTKKSSKPQVFLKETTSVSSASAKANNITGNNTPDSPYVRIPLPRVQYYYIQVIATENVERAQKVFGELKKRSYPVHVKKSAKDDKMLYAIRVGLYKKIGLAKKHLRLIRKGGGYMEAFMKPYKVEQ